MVTKTAAVIFNAFIILILNDLMYLFRFDDSKV